MTTLCVVSHTDNGTVTSMPADESPDFYAEIAAHVVAYAAANGATLEDILVRARSIPNTTRFHRVPAPFLVQGAAG